MVLIFTEGGKPEIIRLGSRARAGRHDAKEYFGRRDGCFIEGPDVAGDIVTKDVLSAEVSRELAASVNVPTDDRVAIARGMVVIKNGAFVDAQVRRGKVAIETLDNTPLEIEP